MVYGRFVLGYDGEVDCPSLRGRSDLLILHITAVFIVAAGGNSINRRFDLIICMIGIIRVQLHLLLYQHMTVRSGCLQVVCTCKLHIFGADAANRQIDAERHIEVYQSRYRRR
ncbi:hypothetical protein D3C86_1489370 [compost metagenome]